jgi:hypothetical protein
MSAEVDHEAVAAVDRAPPRDASAAVEVALVEDMGPWNELLARAPVPHLPQSFAYGEGKRATGWTVRRAVFRLQGRPVAFATVLEKRLLGLRIVARVNRGPIFLDSQPSLESQGQVYSALRRRWRGPLLIASALEPSEESDKVLRGAGFVRRQALGWLSGRIDLTRDEGAIWAGFASTFRNRARQAEKAGAVLRIGVDMESFEWMIARHLENMRDKHFTGASPALLRGLRAVAPESVMVFQMLHEGQPVAGMSVVQFGELAEYHIGWFGPEGRKLNAGNFLMWHILRDLKARGVASFDVGGMRPGDGYTRFKRTMNPVEFQLAGEWMSL